MLIDENTYIGFTYVEIDVCAEYFDLLRRKILCKNIRFKNNCFDPLNKILRISQICVDKGITKIL